LAVLYEQCATDDQVALVVAHEIAHHDLGHINLFAGWADTIIGLPGATLFAFAFHALERRIYGPEKEREADRHGMDHCPAAGYNGNRALELIDNSLLDPDARGGRLRVSNLFHDRYSIRSTITSAIRVRYR
jgi:hypothetical protein